MSRSYKKPWIKDKGTYLKKVCSRTHRHACRQICHVHRKKINAADRNCKICAGATEYAMEHCGLCIEISFFPLRNELVNQWDVCDWRFYGKEPRYKRK